jgi:tyrosine-protein kinase Etk/Wzc
MQNQSSILTVLQGAIGNDFNLGLFLSIVRRSLIWVFFLFALSIGLVLLYLRYTPPTFQANSTLMLKAEKTADILGLDELLSANTDDLLREIEIVKSSLLLNRALSRMELDVSYYIEGRSGFLSTEVYQGSPFHVDVKKVNDPGIYNSEIHINFIDATKYTLIYTYQNQQQTETFLFNDYFESKTGAFEIKISLMPNLKGNITDQLGKPYFFTINDKKLLMQKISSNITVEPLSTTTKTLRIGYIDQNTLKAQDIVSVVTSEFIKYNVERKMESAVNILQYIEQQIDTFSIQLADFQDSLKKFRVENGFIDPTQTMGQMVDQIYELESRQYELDSRTKTAQWYFEYLESLKDLRSISPSLFNKETSELYGFIDELKELEKERDKMLLDVSEAHPKVIMLTRRLDEIQNYLYNEIQNLLIKLKFEKENVDAQHGRFLNDLLSMPEKEAEFIRLNRRYKLTEEIYLSLLDKQAQYNIARAGIISDYIILDGASTSNVPTSPKKAVIWLISISIASILSVLIMAFRYMLHTTITSVEDVRRSTKAIMLGMVPTVYSDIPSTSIVVNQNPKSIVSEALRSLRANMQFISKGDDPKTIAITSTISGEGKTFIAINLGAIIAFLNKKVIILDLDMRRPRLSKIFNVPNDKGMSTMLINKHTIEECVHNTEISNLKFITSGPIPPNPAELILSDKLKEVVEELKKQYDFVLFDTPPLGLVTDGLEVIKDADYPIYIFRADYSDKAFITNLDTLIDENGVKNLSVILNDVGRGVSGYYYGYGGYGYSYGYGYGFGYYSDETKPQRTFLNKIFGKK